MWHITLQCWASQWWTHTCYSRCVGWEVYVWRFKGRGPFCFIFVTCHPEGRWLLILLFNSHKKRFLYRYFCNIPLKLKVSLFLCLYKTRLGVTRLLLFDVFVCNIFVNSCFYVTALEYARNTKFFGSYCKQSNSRKTGGWNPIPLNMLKRILYFIIVGKQRFLMGSHLYMCWEGIIIFYFTK